MALRYKFVELSVVTDETLEEAVNTWVARGWTFDGVRFVTTDASRRPSMAFVGFVREDAEPREVAAGTSVPDDAPVVRPRRPAAAPIELGELDLDAPASPRRRKR